jgi:HK97 family phage major capsid protein
MVLSSYAAQVSADAVINFGDDLAGEISYAFALKEDQCAFLGDGTSPYGGIIGCVTKLSKVDGTNPSVGLITAGTTGAWSSLVLADFHNVVGTLPQYADTPEAVWITHKTFYYSVMQRLELAAGGVPAREVQMGGGGVFERGRPLFLGYPVDFSQVLPNATAGSQVCALFGDFTLGGTFGDRQQDSIAFSDAATIAGQSMFERNEIAIRGTERMDINIHDAGSASTGNGGTGLPGPIVGLTT